MCGICGIIRFDGQIVQETPIRKMMQLVKHRGPDDDGVFFEENVGFGFVRLSVIDLSSAGHQPKFSQDERYVILFNGEIYNYLELREELKQEGVVFSTQTDTEVFLNAYIVWGENCMHRFNGMWAVVIYDRQEKSVFAARDRFGIKPFYYIHTDNFFSFCSEIPPLLNLIDKKPKPNNQSIFDFLVFNRTDQIEDTFFEDVKKLQHGHVLKVFGNLDHVKKNNHISESRISIKKWYDLRAKVSQTQGIKNPKEFKELLSSAIDLHLRSDVPVGVCLSGGLDSSSIVSILLEDFNKKEINTFSAVYKKGQIGDETEFIDEYKPYVKNMFFVTPTADSLEKDLLTFIKTHSEPFPGTSPYAQYKVMELAKGKVVVTLDGQGADESLGGYHYFFGFYFKDLLGSGNIIKLSNEIACYLKEHHSFFGVKSFLYFLLPKRLRTKVRVGEKNYLHSNFVNQHQDSNSISGNIYGSKTLKDAFLDHFEYKLEHLLKWEDRNSMSFSIEARVPFLDYRFVEKLLATQSEQKIKKGVTKFILREAMKGILPEKIRLRKDKIGFGTPEDEWFRTPSWQKIIIEILNSESFKNRKLIDHQKAIKQYQKHLSCDINIASEIWKWIHLELWFRMFIDEVNLN
ncbi:MAG: asparagine synthase (glutamine-hydrolyzing) [Bacteroidota bacterium]